MDRNALCQALGVSPGLPVDATPCCVCGEETKNRCSACGDAGTSLFFCSREHQKLIWPVHKRVCGSKSTPCQLPFLTSKEAQDVKKNLETVVQVSPLCSMTVAGFLRHSRPDASREHLEMFVDAITSGSSYSLAGLQSMLTIIRSLRWFRLKENGEEDLDPFDCLARLEAEIQQQLPSEKYGAAPWQSDLRHKALIFFALKQLHFSPSPPPALETFHAPTASMHLNDYITDKLDCAQGHEVASKVRLAWDAVFPSRLFPPLKRTSGGEGGEKTRKEGGGENRVL
ncbi:hypothetical protein JCM6882_007578 [Rhodosporidiobolus microsporus]